MELSAEGGLEGGSLKASLPAPLAADQICKAPEASQEAIREVVLPADWAKGSQHRAVTGLECPVYCTPAAHHCHVHPGHDVGLMQDDPYSPDA